MVPLTTMLFGLGLFFLGLQLVGDNLRKMISGRFRDFIKRSTQSPLLGVGLGLGVGALMQSATAATFILVSMTASGLLTVAAAAPILIWCNVGLTALAFIISLNIHPLAAFVVGGAGVVMGTIRIPKWRTIASVLLGLGMILIGLEQMGAGAEPMKNTEWFRAGIDAAASNPIWAFLAGIAAAALLQSNTGAAMLVITLAAHGFIPLVPAILMIYGTNLGLIGLRTFLAAGLRSEQRRVVLLENFFCLVSGLLMFGLYGLESLGIPLVVAVIEAIPASINIKLAFAFLFSNLLPALLLSPFLGSCLKLLQKVQRDKPQPDAPGLPHFLHNSALDDPPTALDLIKKELARLLGFITLSPPETTTGDEPSQNFSALARSIESFASKLAAQNTLDEATAEELHLLRAELSIIRHIEESVRYYSQAPGHVAGVSTFDTPLTSLLKLATQATETGSPAVIAELHDKTKVKGPFLAQLQEEARTTGASLSTTASFEDLAAVTWSLHRLAKILAPHDQ